MRVKLTDICDIQYGYAFDSSMFSETEGTPLVRIRDVVRGFTETRTTESFPLEYAVHDGDILIGMDGEFNISRWHGGTAALNQRVCRLIPKDVDADYIFHFMPSALKAIEAKTPFVTVKHLSAKELNKITVPVPTPEEQIRIGTILNRILSIIDSRRRELANLDDLIKARFVEMFGDLKSNSKHWKKVGFTECAAIDTNMIHDFDGYEDYPHIGIDSIEKDTGRLSGYRTIAEDGVISGKYLFTPQHIIYSKIRPNLNKVALPVFTGLCSADAYPILVNVDVCTREYLGYTMRSNFFLDYILAFSNRTNLPKVNKAQVEGFSLPLPPIELQKQFAEFIKQIDKSKFVVQQALNETKLLFDGFMQKYFGKED